MPSRRPPPAAAEKERITFSSLIPAFKEEEDRERSLIKGMSKRGAWGMIARKRASNSSNCEGRLLLARARESEHARGKRGRDDEEEDFFTQE